MFSWSTEAVEAWSALVTAIVAMVGLPLLLWDRFRAKPHQVSGYLALSPNGVLSVYVYSELSERLILTRLDGRPHFQLARKDPRTPAERHAGVQTLVLWIGAIPVRKVAEAGHTGNEPLAEVQIRMSRSSTRWLSAKRLLLTPTITARGVLPYRTRGRRFKVELALPEQSLRVAVLRMELKRKGKS